MVSVRVECYSGHTYAQEPRVVVQEGFRVAVTRVDRRWLTPQGPAFLVHLESGATLYLLYVAVRDQWLAGSDLFTLTEG